ncbi:SDR family oxidoreductase [Shewanella litorisediminis]|uniref:SDR family oxidoreductase n=1 Tax=Shewanella litorisediminis TaxID=1173586 RepID=A0ABX7G791_9GAMM|nr:SDR family oxidoreductase [Shewanella litorisediminis]MCL2919800.1 SDR family oxidoreductase [Shewanella litorisediminis]QRH03229.1 SDR family oxidoreductase [Shewanella litorisediminis]
MFDFKTISIIGCGWFGLPLARLLKSKGLTVKGCKRTPAGVDVLTQAGIEGYCVDLDQDAALPEGLLDADVLVINLPPGLRRGDTSYLERLVKLRDAIKTPPKRLIFISSTGVYPDLPQLLDEKDSGAHSPTAAILLGAEALFAGFDTTVVRFAGLVGPLRHPGRFFAGKQDIAGGAVPVNLVHLTDCIDGVTALIFADKVASCYNLCAPQHPAKAEFYRMAAQAAGYELPEFIADDDTDGKLIDGSLICRLHGFVYSYPDPLAMLNAPGAF